MVEGGNTREECERESEKVSASCSSLRWQDNKLWEDDGAVMALAGDGESGSISMLEERVGMVSREAEVERGMADGRVIVAVVDASDLFSSNSNSKSLNGFEILGSGGKQPGAVPTITEQLGGVCLKTKSVNAIVESLLSPTQRVVIEDVSRK
ncbi:hypothetical protein V6N13_040107 [Hibiscus sabdariffa]